MEPPVSGARVQLGQVRPTMEAPEAGARPLLAPRVTQAGAGPGQHSEARLEARVELLVRDPGAERPSGRSRALPWPGGLMTEAPASGEEEDQSQPCLEDRLVVSTPYFPGIVRSFGEFLH